MDFEVLPEPCRWKACRKEVGTVGDRSFGCGDQPRRSQVSATGRALGPYPSLGHEERPHPCQVAHSPSFAGNSTRSLGSIERGREERI
jgi:hypothetical protein